MRLTSFRRDLFIAFAIVGALTPVLALHQTQENQPPSFSASPVAVEKPIVRPERGLGIVKDNGGGLAAPSLQDLDKDFQQEELCGRGSQGDCKDLLKRFQTGEAIQLDVGDRVHLDECVDKNCSIVRIRIESNGAVVYTKTEEIEFK
jgi:hypothetical protein